MVLTAIKPMRTRRPVGSNGPDVNSMVKHSTMMPSPEKINIAARPNGSTKYEPQIKTSGKSRRTFAHLSSVVKHSTTRPSPEPIIIAVVPKCGIARSNPMVQMSAKWRRNFAQVNRPAV